MQDTMDVLYITKTSPFSESGGGEKRAREVTRGLADRGHQVTLVCGKTDPDLKRWTEHGGCRVRHVTCIPDWLFAFDTASFFLARYLFPFVSFPVLVGLLVRDEFDVAIENMTPYPSPSIAATELFGVPLVAVYHEFHDRSCFSVYDPVTATILLTVQNVLRIADYDAVIVPTSHVKRRLTAYGIDEGRIQVISNGITADAYWRPDVERSPHRLVTVGRLSKRKGHDDVLRAFERVSRTHPSAKLDVVGTGPRRDRLETLATNLGIRSRVTFHGFVSEAEKIRLLNRASVFVFGSRQEGFGIVLLEAMAAGLPVVARRLPVYEDFFERGVNGALVRGTPDALASHVETMLSNPRQTRRIGHRNRETAAQFTWQQVARDTERALNRVVERSVPHRTEESSVRS